MSTTTTKPWPVPLPRWYWAWARWTLGEGEYKQHGPKKGPRPKEAPEKIPGWAWKRLETLLAQRKGEKTDPRQGPPAQAKPKPSAWQQMMQRRRDVVAVALELAKVPHLIDYSQARPIPPLAADLTWEQARAHLRAGKHLTLDCSGLVKACWWWGAGIDFDGLGDWGNTWTFMDRAQPVATPALGDAVMYRGHTAIIVAFRDGKPTRDLDDILIVSHGSQPGPYGWPVGELAAGYRSDFEGFRRPWKP